MITEPTPFRAVWISLGKLRERLGEQATMEAQQEWTRLANDIAKAEKEFQLLNRGAGEN